MYLYTRESYESRARKGVPVCRANALCTYVLHDLSSAEDPDKVVISAKSIRKLRPLRIRAGCLRHDVGCNVQGASPMASSTCPACLAIGGLRRRAISPFLSAKSSIVNFPQFRISRPTYSWHLLAVLGAVQKHLIPPPSDESYCSWWSSDSSIVTVLLRCC